MAKQPATQQEPAPTSGREDVWPRVIDGFEEFIPAAPPALREAIAADMRARDAMGREKYGTPLQTHSGRDAATDAYQEALDLCAYTYQRYAETQAYLWRQMHRKAVEMVSAIRAELSRGEG